jgi:2-iminobutanoate/2-iminopropanoate deaminase
MRHITPPGIRPPFARYSYGVEIPAGHRILVCSGQLGVTPDDRVPATIEEQTHLCFRNIGAVLEQASFGFGDIVRINSFVVSREHLKGYMSVRDLYIGDPAPASTLMIVSGFSRPEFLVEVEVIAAAQGAAAAIELNSRVDHGCDRANSPAVDEMRHQDRGLVAR